MKKLLVTGATAAALVAGAGTAWATGPGAGDPLEEQRQEVRFTAAHATEVSVTRDEAVSTALGVHPGRLVDVHLEDEGRGLVWEVKPADGEVVHEVQVDATTGAVVSDHLDD